MIRATLFKGGGDYGCFIWRSLAATVVISITPLSLGQDTGVSKPPPGNALATNSSLFPGWVSWIGDASPSESEKHRLSQVFDRATVDGPLEAVLSLQLTDDLESFLRNYPKSGYGPEIRTKLARHYGERTRYTKALAHWQRAETDSRESKTFEGRRVHDFALAQGALLSAYIGDLESVEAAISLKSENPIQGGAAADAWNRAMEVYRRLKGRPELGFRCGVFALGHLARSVGAEYDARRLYDTLSSEAGLSLLALIELGEIIGFPVEAIKVSQVDELVIPSIAHYRESHFVALTRIVDDQIEVKDPSAGQTSWVVPEDVFAASTGYFLVPTGEPLSGQQQVSDLEAAKISGRGSACLVLDSEDGAACGSPSDCERCQRGDDVGMPTWRVSEPFLNLWVEDTPLVYQPALGDERIFTLGHRQRVGEHPDAQFQVTSFGYGWHSSWTSMVSLAGSLGGGVEQVTVGHPGGRLGWYLFSSASALQSERNYWDNSTLERWRNGSQVVGYQLNLPDGSRLEYGYRNPETGAFYLTEQVSPEGYAVVWNYDSSNRMEHVEDASGNKTWLRYRHPGDDTLVSQMDLQMRVNGRLQTVRSVSFDYTRFNSEWRLSRIIDPVGIESHIEYGNQGWITSLTTPYGTTEFDYFESGTPSSGPTPSDPFQRWVTIREPEGLESAYAAIDFDATGMPATFRSEQYPATGQALDGAGSGTEVFPTHTLDLPVGAQPGYATSRRNRNTFYWNPLQWGSLGVTVPSAVSWRELKRARIRHWLWEDQDHMDTLSYEQAPSPDGSTEGIVTFYDYEGKQASFRNGTQILPSLVARRQPDGSIWYQKVERNLIGNLVSLTETYTAERGGVALRTANYGYASNLIDLTSVKNFVGQTFQSYTYNGKHQPLTVSLFPDDGTHYQKSFTYDSLSRLRTLRTPSGLTRTFEYGSDGYLWQFRDSPTGRTESFTWEAGEISSHTDARGLLRRFDYDGLRRRTRVDYPDGTYEAFRYTANGQSGGAPVVDLTWQRDRMGAVTEFRYDGARRLIRQINALGRSRTYDYCDCGAIEGITDERGHRTAFDYDFQGNRTRIVYPNNEGVIDLAYDSLGRLIRRNNRLSTQTVAYNQQGLVQEVGTTQSGRELLVRYNSLDQPIVVTDEHGFPLTQTFDRLGRLLMRRTAYGGVERFDYSPEGLIRYEDPLQALTNYEYDTAGRLIGVTSPNNVSLRYTYDPSGDLESLTDGRQQRTSWIRDIEGRVVRKRNANDQVVLTLGYNARGSVTSRTDALQRTTGYRYDLVGNLVGVDYSDDTPDLDLSYDARNELIRMNDGYGTTTFGTTASGLVAFEDGPGSHDRVSYQYNGAGGRSRMTLQQPNGLWVQQYTYEERQKVRLMFEYDGFNRLRERSASVWEGETSEWQEVVRTQFIYDGQQIVREWDVNSEGPRITYTRGLDLSGDLVGAGGIGGLLAYTDHTAATERTAYYHSDGNGNVTAMINASGREVARYQYDPYGNLQGMSGPLAGLNRYRYSSKEAQPYSGLYFYGFRFYDPSLQRWINQDPLAEAGGINLYGFVSNDPVNRVDPWGLTDGDLTELGNGVLRPGMLIDPYFDDPRNPGNPITGGDLAREVGGEVVWAMIPGGLGKAKNLKHAPPPSSVWLRFKNWVGKLGKTKNAICPITEAASKKGAKFFKGFANRNPTNHSTRQIGEFTEFAVDVPGNNGKSFTRWTKVVGQDGRTIRYFHDTFDNTGKFLNRGVKFPGPERHIYHPGGEVTIP